MRSDVSALEQVDPPAFKSDVQIEPSEEVPVGSKFLNMSAPGSRRKAWSEVRDRIVIADGQVTARDQGVWLSRNDEFVLDGELASVTEESLGDNRGFIEVARPETCVWSVARDNHPVFSNKRARIEPKDADGQRLS